MSFFPVLRASWARVAAMLLLPAMAVSPALTGCGTTKQARSVMPSGFLENYSGLRKGIGDEPLLVYGNPAADCRKYTKLIIDPVTLWARGDHSSMQQLSEEDRDMLRTLGYQAISGAAAGAGLQIVTQPGAEVMRIRAAFTEAAKANVLLEDASIAAPYVSGAATVYAEAKGQGLFTGDEAFEVEMLDSLTGERLYAAVDKRVGLLDVRNFGGWDPLKAALKVWQDRGAQRMQSCRQTGSFLLKPHEEGWQQDIERYRP